MYVQRLHVVMKEQVTFSVAVWLTDSSSGFD